MWSSSLLREEKDVRRCCGDRQLMSEISCCDVIIHSLHFLQWVCLIFEYPRELLPPPSQHLSLPPPPPALPRSSRTSPFLSPRAHIGFPYVCARVCKSVSESAQPSLDDRGPRTIQTTRTPVFSPPPEQLRERNSPEKEQQKSQI